jgi:putative ABC transport system permease protein
MSIFSRLRLLLRAKLTPDEVEADIDDELRYHLEMRTREYRSRGIPEASARELASERFGDLKRVRHECRRLSMLGPFRRRSEKGDPPMSSFSRDLFHAVRSLIKTPGFTLVVLLTLALGVGANTAIFSVVEGVLLRPFPFREPDRLVRIWENDRLRGTTREGFSLPDFLDVTERSDAFAGLAVFQNASYTLTDAANEPMRVNATRSSSGLFALLGVVPSIGRDFAERDGRPGSDPVALLSHRLWVGRFGGDPSVVGRTISLEGVTTAVIGVLPPGVPFPSTETDLYLPLPIPSPENQRGFHGFGVVARLGDGVSLERANAGLQAIATALEGEFGDDNKGRGMWAQSLYDASVGAFQARLVLLLGAVALVLLVACVNVASLLFARAVARERETAVRVAMGAGRGALVRQYLTESLLLSIAGGLVGLLAARIGLSALLAMVPEDLPRRANIGINGVVLAFTLAISVATGLVFGLLPALRGAPGRLLSLLREGGRSGGDRVKQGIRRILVTAEIGLAVALVVGAGLLVESFWRLVRVDPGFSAESVVSVDVQLPSSRYPQDRARWPAWSEVRAFQNELLRRVRSLPGVESAAIAINTPLDEGWHSRFTIEGREPVSPGDEDEVSVRVVSPGYFRTAGIAVLRGRAIEERDDGSDSPPVVVVNEAFAKRYFADSDPIGARLSQWGVSREIVGVVKDVRFQGLERPAPPAIYPTFARAPFAGFSLLVRSREPAERTYSVIRETVGSIDGELALSRVTTLGDLLTASISAPRFTVMLFVLFAAIALGLAAVGIYGVMSYSVTQRRHEMGVRMSLGARPADVVRLVLVESGRLTGLGIGIGLVLAMFLTRSLKAILFGVEGLDPTTLVVVTVLSAVVALAASCLPAVRAARLDPISTLRHE